MTTEDKLKHYTEKVELFHGMPPEDVSYILNHGRIFEFQQGKTIFHEGSLGSSIFIVLHGEVAVYKRDKQIARLKSGDAFGEMAVLNHEPQHITAVARSEVRVFTLDEEEINRILKKDIAVRFLLNIIHSLSQRFEETANLVATHAR